MKELGLSKELDLPGCLTVDRDIFGMLKYYSDQCEESFRETSRDLEALDLKIRGINYRFAHLGRDEIQAIFKEVEKTLYYVSLGMEESEEAINNHDIAFGALLNDYSKDQGD